MHCVKVILIYKNFYSFLLITCLLTVENVLGQERIEENTLLECTESGYARCVQLAIEAGDDLNVRDSFNNTPIIYAIQRSDTRIVKILMDAGADIRAHEGSSLLITAAHFSSCNIEINSMLLSAGADVNATNAAGQTPLSINITKATILEEEPWKEEYREDKEEEKLRCVEIIRTLLNAGAKTDRLHRIAYQRMLCLLREANNMSN